MNPSFEQGNKQATSIKLSASLVLDARRDAAAFNRSVAGQVEHWARLGQAVELAPGFTLERVKAALEGRFDVDGLSSEERVYFDDMLSDMFDDPPQQVRDDYAELGRQGGVGYDDEDRLVRGRPDGTTELLED